jgi:hypothetical protein
MFELLTIYIMGTKERADDGGKVKLVWDAGRLNTCARKAGRRIANHILVPKCRKGKAEEKSKEVSYSLLHFDIWDVDHRWGWINGLLRNKVQKSTLANLSRHNL